MTNREAIIILKNLKKCYNSYYFNIEDNVAIDIAISALEKIEQTRWIPVSSGKLPEDGQKVWVTIRSGDIIDVDTCIFHHASAYWKHYVIAWMPLPESYNEENKTKQGLAYADQDTLMSAT